MIDILDILNNVVSSVADSGIITNISEVSGIYTITANTELLLNNQIIEIFNTPNFNGIYSVSNVTSNSFDIEAETGKAIISFGNWKCKQPFYDYGNWVDLQSKKLNENLKSNKLERETYPVFFIWNDFTEKQYMRSFKEINNLKIYLINQVVNLYTLTEKQRKPYIEYLKKLTEKFRQNLLKNTNIIKVNNFTSKADFYYIYEITDTVQIIEINLEIIYNFKNNCN